MIPVSICVIMKDEESHLPSFIQSIQKAFINYPYELIIVDTGSTDNSISIAKDSGATVLNFKWINDFSAARNYGIENAQNDLILVLDCDEYITSIDTSLIDSFFYNHMNSIGMITLNNEIADSDSLYSSELPRLFNRNKFRFAFPIHELPRPIYEGSFDYVSFPLTALHVGYALSQETLKKKAERNIELLIEEIKKKEDPYILFQIGQAYYSIHENENACEYFSRACEYDLDPRLQYVQMMIISYGYSLLECNRYDEALAFENIYDEFATTADFIVLMGIIYLRTGNVAQAIEQFTRATQTSKFFNTSANSSIPLYNLGCINEVLGNVKEAITFYDRCGDFPPAKQRLKEIEE